MGETPARTAWRVSTAIYFRPPRRRDTHPQAWNVWEGGWPGTLRQLSSSRRPRNLRRVEDAFAVHAKPQLRAMRLFPRLFAGLKRNARLPRHLMPNKWTPTSCPPSAVSAPSTMFASVGESTVG